MKKKVIQISLLALNSYVTALEQYPITDETSNDPILELEHEFWTQSMLNCCNQLNNWTIMSKHIFIDPIQHSIPYGQMLIN